MTHVEGHGTLSGGEYYDVPVYFYGGPRWSLDCPSGTKVVFRCVGHSTGKEAWLLDNACPDQPLPPLPLGLKDYRMEILGLLAKALTPKVGKVIRGANIRGKIEWPHTGPGSFWLHAPDVAVVGNSYNALMENNGASYAVEKPPVSDRKGENA